MHFNSQKSLHEFGKGEKAREASSLLSSSCTQRCGLSLRTPLPSTSGPYVSTLIFNPNWLFQAYLKQDHGRAW